MVHRLFKALHLGPTLISCEAKKCQCKCENLYHYTKLTVHKDIYHAARLKLKFDNQFQTTMNRCCQGAQVRIDCQSIINIWQILKAAKKALVKPSDYKNHQHVSDFLFISKVIKRAVAHQLKSYHSANNLDHELKSAYRAKHCRYTALLKVYSDLSVISG